MPEDQIRNVLVVGGAGYVGSHAVRRLSGKYSVWVYDNLSRGHRAAVPAGCLIQGDLMDRQQLTDVLRQHEIDAVMHFAAFALVGESVEHPEMYYRNNVVATYHLLESMRAAGVKRLIFSSTTATYGEPTRVPIKETETQLPINPYGFTKMVSERMMADYSTAYGLSYAALRYFNAAGASPGGEIGEDHDPESHLIPIVLQVALGQRENVSIFGNDYSTADGTCVRDYVHVDDLAEAHALALQCLPATGGLHLNLGTGRGTSVQEVVTACRDVTGHAIPAKISKRRPGDPACLVADASQAAAVLGWRPRYQDINSIVATAWEWHRSHPHGYGE